MTRTSIIWIAAIAAMALWACSEETARDYGDGGADADTDTDADTDADSDSDGDGGPDGGDGGTDGGTDGGQDDCGDSPVVGEWTGQFDGNVDSDITGPAPTSGTMSFEIVCTDKLYLSGEMDGTEVGGVSFEAQIEGEYDESANYLESDIEGNIVFIANIPFTGTLTGQVISWSPIEMSGVWSGEAPTVNGVGSGTWTATML